MRGRAEEPVSPAVAAHKMQAPPPMHTNMDAGLPAGEGEGGRGQSAGFRSQGAEV